MRRGAEDVLTAVLGQDLDQGAVHVKRDRLDVHARILPQGHYRTRAAAARAGRATRRSGGQGKGGGFFECPE